MASKAPRAGGIKRILSTDMIAACPSDDYEDIRAELRANGHNLTSVLVNPRETLFGQFFDEFETDQLLPLETTQVVVLPEVDMKSVQSLARQVNRVYPSWSASQLALQEPPPRPITQEDVNRCFQQVPELYFRPDFSLRDPEIFETTLGCRAPESYNEKLSQVIKTM